MARKAVVYACLGFFEFPAFWNLSIDLPPLSNFFQRYSVYMTFDKACLEALAELKKRENLIPRFDYILIDESQDFPDSFIELCRLVSRGTLYVAGDIFQSIFDENITPTITPDYLLSKCYRTDPRTLMFAHAIGMGLFEQSKLRWLEAFRYTKVALHRGQSPVNARKCLIFIGIDFREAILTLLRKWLIYKEFLTFV